MGNSAPNTVELEGSSPEIPNLLKDPITGRVMTDPIMVLSSMKVYDRTTIRKWRESERYFEPITGIPVQIGGWEKLLVPPPNDIRSKIDNFVTKYPQYRQENFDEHSENIKWESLFESQEEKIRQEHNQIAQNQNDLKKKAKQILNSIQNSSNIKYDESTILQPEIPIVCIVGPSKSGKSTIINDILDAKEACKTSTRSNVPLTKGGWIAMYSTPLDKLISDIIDSKEEEKGESGFYLVDMEGLSHNVTNLTKRLFYAGYVMANVVIWNDTQIMSDRFKKLMQKLKKEIKDIARSDDKKPAFLYLKRDAGDCSHEPYNTFNEYINKDESFEWLRELNIFSSLSAIEIDRASSGTNNKKGELNFGNQELLIPVIDKITMLCKGSSRFAENAWKLQQLISRINKLELITVDKRRTIQSCCFQRCIGCDL